MYSYLQDAAPVSTTYPFHNVAVEIVYHVAEIVDRVAAGYIAIDTVDVACTIWFHWMLGLCIGIGERDNNTLVGCTVVDYDIAVVVHRAAATIH